jgi:hypothetical protein
LTVASFHPHHHPDPPCGDRHANTKHQDGRHNAPPSLLVKRTLRRCAPAV